MGKVIARRVYGRSDRLRSRVVLEIGTPRKVGRGWDWACPVRIVGLDDCPKSPEPIFGIDAVQALECAMHYARGTLSKVSPSLTWQNQVGEIGLPLSVPGYLPSKFRARVEAAIDRELKRFVGEKRGRDDS
jgi:hypothetical protein